MTDDLNALAKLLADVETYKPGDYLLFKESLAPKFDRKNGRTITLYLTQEEYEGLHMLKRMWHCNTWPAFVNHLLKEYEL